MTLEIRAKFEWTYHVLTRLLLLRFPETQNILATVFEA